MAMSLTGRVPSSMREGSHSVPGTLEAGGTVGTERMKTGTTG